jgi:hypothetical protein
MKKREMLNAKFHLYVQHNARIQIEIKAYAAFLSGTLPEFVKNFVPQT